MKTRSLLLAAFGLVAAGAAHAAGPGPSGAAPARHQALMQRLAAADVNGDGMLSREEAAALPKLAAHFDQVDANHDGFITREELRAAFMKQVVAHLRKADTDGDGRLSRAEAEAGAPRLAAHFDRIDADGDGYITREEMQAAMQKLKAARAGR